MSVGSTDRVAPQSRADLPADVVQHRLGDVLVTFPTPGGDAFCARYIDRHLAAMEAAGAEVEVNRGRVRARFTGTRLPFITDAETRSWGPSLGATVTAMLLAARTPGTSAILNPSVEPEVTHTAALLSQAGVGIEWRGRTALNVTGTDRIRGGVFTVPPDRLEASTLALAAAITGGTVHLDGFPPAAFPDGLVSVFADAGIQLDPLDGGTAVSTPAGPRPVQMATGPHPGFPTDVQPQLTAFLTQAEGTGHQIDHRDPAGLGRTGSSPPWPPRSTRRTPRRGRGSRLRPLRAGLRTGHGRRAPPGPPLGALRTMKRPTMALVLFLVIVAIVIGLVGVVADGLEYLLFIGIAVLIVALTPPSGSGAGAGP